MKKEFIGGKPVSRREVYKELGDPKTWPAHKVKVMKEFKRKPKELAPTPRDLMEAP